VLGRGPPGDASFIRDLALKRRGQGASSFLVCHLRTQQENGVFMKRGNEDRYSWREDQVKTQGEEDSHLQAKKRSFRRKNLATPLSETSTSLQNCEKNSFLVPATILSHPLLWQP
jgi:uncharacterized protein YdaU (DUF1376 family)